CRMGARVWFRLMRKETARVELIKCQRQVLYASLNVCRTVSTEAMQVLHGGLPWNLEVTRKGLLSGFRRNIALVEGDPVTSAELEGFDYARCARLVNARIMAIWHDRWDGSTLGRLTSELIPEVTFASEHDWFAPGFCLSCSLNGSLHRFGLMHTAECL